MQQLSSSSPGLIEQIDPAIMLAQTQAGARSTAGPPISPVWQQWQAELADAFSVLPGEVTLENPAPVTAIAPDGNEVQREHGRHLVLASAARGRPPRCS